MASSRRYDLDYPSGRTLPAVGNRLSRKTFVIFKQLDAVVLERDLPEHSLRKGDLGAVVHIHDETRLEVEFVRVSGRTQAVVELAAGDVRPVRDEDLPAVRSVSARGAG